MTKKLFTLLLAVAASIGTMFASTKIGILYYNLDETNLTAEVTYQYSNSSNNYSNLTTLDIPSVISYNSQNYNVTSIGEKAFNNCRNLTSVTIPESIIEIGERAFYQSKIVSVNIPSSISQIANYTFWCCKELKAIIIPSNVRNIGVSAFYECSKLSSLTLSEGIETIGDHAFHNCFSLSTITIPESISSIGVDAFSSAESVVWNAINCADFTEEGGPFSTNSSASLITSFKFGSKVEHIPAYICQNLAVITSISIPSSVTSIGESAFCRCNKMKTLTISEGVTSIGQRAFMGCSALTTVTLPNSLTKIEKFTFYYCNDLTSVKIGDGVTIIEDSAFYLCPNLKTATFGSGIQYIGKDVFGWLTSVKIKDLAAWYNVSFAEDDRRYTVLGDGYNLYLNNNIVYDLEIPDGISNIRKHAFAGCSSIQSVSIPNTVTSIEPFAFCNCTNLKSLSIGANVTTIGDFAFSGAKLSSVIIPNKVTTIGEFSFSGNTNMRVLNIGKNVSSIGNHAFASCYNLTSVTSKSIIPPSMGNYVFGVVNCSEIPLYVRNESVGLYKEADQWKDFLNVDTIVSQSLSVIFMDWDGTPLASVEVEEDDSVTAPIIPTRDGYTFIGWDKDLSIITSNVTVTAQYKINYYKVDFVDWDGTVLKSDSVMYNEGATAPEVPEREWYTFVGWDKDFSRITGDLIVNAKYEEGLNKEYIVLFTNSTDSSEISDTIISLKMPVPPTIDGFTFVGWRVVEADLLDVIEIVAVYSADVPTSAPTIWPIPEDKSKKLIRHGNVYILRGNKTYTLQGQEVK